MRASLRIARRVYVADTKSIKEARSIVVRQLSVAIFILIDIAMPSLYMYGYIDSLTSRLQSLSPLKHKISENFSIGFAFVLGAIVSGILGNFSYDVLKFVVSKVVTKK